MKPEKIKSFLKISLFVVAAAWISHTFAKNFIVDPNFKKFLLEKAVQTNSAAWFWILRVHIFLALIALLTGAIGFIGRLRERSIKLHRYSGRIYVGSILLNFAPSVYLTFFATGGWLTALGFLLLNSLWVGTTYQAYRAVRSRQIAAHRRWMIRSYAVTLANLQLYVLKTILSKAAGMDFETAYAIAVWSCWTFGLLVAELIIWKLSNRVSEKSAAAPIAAERASAAN